LLHRTFKLGLVAATALAAALPLLASPAYADYAPAKNDVVGVGSDVLQYMIDFLANGDAYGDSGFGASNPHYLLVNIDATADANGRLAYGVSGGAAQGTVVGTGATFASGATTITVTGGTVPGPTQVGGAVSGPGIASGTTLVSVSFDTVTLSAATTASESNVSLTFSPSGECTPGTGGSPGVDTGTGNGTTPNTGGYPCVLNPTVVLRAGTQAVQRPNGSTAGFLAFQQDILAGNNTFGSNEVISFARASSQESGNLSASVPTGAIDQITVATDPLPMLVNANPSNHALDGGKTDYPLSAQQLSIIYGANNGSCLTWNDPRISGVVDTSVTSVTSGVDTVTIPSGDTVPGANEVGGAVTDSSGAIPGSTTLVSVSGHTVTLSAAPTASPGTDTLSFTNTLASSDQIIPIIPQVGSGTRSYFLKSVVPLLSNPGTCAQVAEENDPTAIHNSAVPADAIEPMSYGRYLLYAGEQNSQQTVSGFTSSGSGPYSVTFTTSNGATFNQNWVAGTTVTVSGVTSSATAPNGTFTITSVNDADSQFTVSVPSNPGTYTSGGEAAGPVNGGLTDVGGGYFLDPSCAYENSTATSGGTPANSCGTGGGTSAFKPQSVTVNDVTPQQTGTPSDGNAIFDPTRPLYIYVRSADLDSTKDWQPTGTTNWVQTLFYTTKSTTPFIDSAEGQVLLDDAGVTPQISTCVILTTSASTSTTPCT